MRAARVGAGSGSSCAQIRTMETLPSEVTLLILSWLTPRDVLHCSSVCQRWYSLINNDQLWRKLFVGTFTPSHRPLRTDVVNTLANHSSWRLVFMCCHLLHKKSSPNFWNDYNLFCAIQELKRPIIPSQLLLCPLNGLVWMMLQLNFDGTGMSSPITRPASVLRHGSNCKEAPLVLLQKWILALCHTLGSEVFLKKLLEVANVPLARHFLPGGNLPSVLTSSLLVQLSHCCVPVSSGAAETDGLAIERSHFPIPFVLYSLDWVKSFIGPVQECTLKALECWGSAVGHGELEQLKSFPQKQTTCIWRLMQQLSEGNFWVGGRGVVVKELLKSIQKKALSCETTFPAAHVVSSVTNKSVSPREAAIKLSSWSFLHLRSVARLDLLEYFTADGSALVHNALNKLILTYCSALGKCVTEFCSEQTHSRKEKITAIHHVIDVCVQLNEVRDYTSLKALLSAIRTAVGQRFLSKLSWNDICMKSCQAFKRLEELMSHQQCYTTYFHHVRQLREPFVPYLPAHRQYVLLHINNCRSPGSVDKNTSSLLMQAPLADYNFLSSTWRVHCGAHCCGVHGSLGHCLYSRISNLFIKNVHSHLYVFDLRCIGAVVIHILSFSL